MTTKEASELRTGTTVKRARRGCFHELGTVVSVTQSGADTYVNVRWSDHIIGHLRSDHCGDLEVAENPRESSVAPKQTKHEMKTKIKKLGNKRGDGSLWFIIAIGAAVLWAGGVVDRALIHNTKANTPQSTNQFEFHHGWHMSLPK